MKNGIVVGRGVMVTVEDGIGNSIIADESGCLGRLNSGKVVVKVIVDYQQRVRGEFFGLERQGGTHAILKRDWTQRGDMRIYKRIIEIREGDNGAYVSYPANCFKLLELYKNGAFKVWEVGITMRGERFFFVSQAVWNIKAYRDGETVTIPAVSDWLSLRKVMFMTEAERQQFETQRGSKGFIAIIPRDHKNLLALKDLEPVSKYVPASEITADGLADNQGRVTWWNDCHGMGSIITAQGAARVHRNNLTIKGALESFENGDVVLYDKLVEPKLTNGQTSAFQYEVIGVRLDLPTFENLAAEMLSDFIKPKPINASRP